MVDLDNGHGEDIVEQQAAASLVTLQMHAFRWDQSTTGHFLSSQAALLDFSLTMRVPGASAYYAEDRAQKRSLGEIFYVPRGTRLDGFAETGRQRSLWCLLHTERMAALSGVEETSLTIERCTDVVNSDIRTNLLRLAREVAEPGFGSALLIDALGLAIFIELQRHMRTMSEMVVPPNGKMALWQVRAVKDRLAAELPAPALEELARLCRVSPRHLMRIFRNSTGETVGNYVARIQMQRAKELLSGSERPIKQISAQLGFSNDASFSRAFKAASGVTPNHFRRTFRNLV